MIMSTKKWLLGVIGGMLVAGAATAQAAETVEIRLSKIDGILLSKLSDTLKADFTSAPTSTSGIEAISTAALKAHTYQLDIFAKVSGANDASNDEGIGSLMGNIVVGDGSIVVAPAGSKPKDGAVPTVVGISPFNDNGSKNGKSQTWGMGGAPSTAADDYVVLRAASLQTYDITQDDEGNDIIPTQWKGNGAPGAGIEVKVGSFTVTFADFVKKTDVRWEFAIDPDNGLMQDQAALWQEDGVSKSGLGGQVSSVGYNFSVVPEPAGLSVLALGALGLLARRRK